MFHPFYLQDLNRRRFDDRQYRLPPLIQNCFKRYLPIFQAVLFLRVLCYTQLGVISQPSRVLYILSSSAYINNQQSRDQMVLAEIAGLIISIPANFFASYLGCYCRIAEDRDMLLPLSAMIFTFYPLVISLPQAHFKLITYTIEQKAQKIDEDEIYPFAFLICLFSITACMFFDKFFLKKCRTQEEEKQKEDDQRIITNSAGLKFFLSLSIILQNFVNYYYVCMQENDDQLFKQIFLFGIFSLFINFAYAYLLSQAQIDRSTIFIFVIFINIGLIFGFLVSLFLPPDILLLTLPCLCAGVQIYCSIFICVPAIFSNGEDNTKDKFRYCSILITFLFVVIYYPLCYLLRI